MSADTAAVIVAGGSGLRFGGRIRKQYLLLKGKPMVWWSLQAFEKCPSIAHIILVVPYDDVDRLGKIARRWKCKKLRRIVPGGRSRAESVREGLRALVEQCRYIAVHDAVRPLVRPDGIEKVIKAARRSKAALAACPSKDTVKLIDANGYVDKTPPRHRVWLAQTPQVFDRAILERAHRKAIATATDDAMLVEKLGIKVQLVESPAENIKVTRPMDLEIARLILKS